MRTFKIDRLTDEQVESLLQEYKERYEKEVDNILETRSPNDYVLDEIYQIVCVLSEIQDTRAALKRIVYGAQSVGTVIEGYDYYRGMNEAADIAKKFLKE